MDTGSISSSSSPSVSELSHPDSHGCSNDEFSAVSGEVNDVLDEAGAAAVRCVVAADAEADANEDPTLGGCGSGVRVVSSVPQSVSPSGLGLLLRSPKPSASTAHGLARPDEVSSRRPSGRLLCLCVRDQRGRC